MNVAKLLAFSCVFAVITGSLAYAQPAPAVVRPDSAAPTQTVSPTPSLADLNAAATAPAPAGASATPAANGSGTGSSPGLAAAPVAAPAGTQAVTPTATPTTAPTGTATVTPTAVPTGLPADAPPSLSSILEQSGVANGKTGDAPAADAPPDLPPGMSLPVDTTGAADTKGLSDEEKQAQEEKKIRKEAFKGAVNGIMPLKPGEIRSLLEAYDETAQATETPIYPDPEPESAFKQISLDPGQKPVVVKTAVGHVTTVSIVDITGQPWPIEDLSWAGNFEVLQPDSGSNMLRITPMARFAKGNVSMRLVGLNPPVILTLSTERKSVHVRMDVQIPELGPNGVAPPIEMPVGTKAGDGKVAAVLDGIAPQGAKSLKVTGIDGRTSAYDLNGQMYVRTPYTLLSPAWNSSAQSADGMHVYTLEFTPVLLLSDKGKMVRAYLNREEQSDVQ